MESHISLLHHWLHYTDMTELMWHAASSIHSPHRLLCGKRLLAWGDMKHSSLEASPGRFTWQMIYRVTFWTRLLFWRRPRKPDQFQKSVYFETSPWRSKLKRFLLWWLDWLEAPYLQSFARMHDVALQDTHRFTYYKWSHIFLGPLNDPINDPIKYPCNTPPPPSIHIRDCGVESAVPIPWGDMKHSSLDAHSRVLHVANFVQNEILGKADFLEKS